MNLDRAFQRRAALSERLERIERSGHPGYLAASSGHRTCDLHGDYAATAGRCPVCEGQQHGSSPRHSAEPNSDLDEHIDPVTLEPVDWFEHKEPQRRRRTA